jgi:hypothetical protein
MILAYFIHSNGCSIAADAHALFRGIANLLYPAYNIGVE